MPNQKGKFMMNKNLILSLAVILSCASFVEAKKCRAPRVIAGALTLFSSQPPAQVGCCGVVTATPTIVTGQGCFTVTSVPTTVILQNPCCPCACPPQAGCPTNQKSTLFTYDVTFCKPFKHRPSVSLNEQITTPSATVPPVGKLFFEFTTPFLAVVG